MADTAVPGSEPGENFYEPISPPGVEDKPAATVQVHDSERILREMPPEDAREIFGEEITAEWSPEDAVKALHRKRGQQGEQPNNTVAFARDGRRSTQTDKEAASDLSFSRRVEHANRLMEALPGIGPERAVGTANEALTGGHIHQYALDDKDRADPLSHGDTPEQAQRRLSALREERAAALHALAEQLSQPTEQQQPAEAPPVETQQPPQEQPPPVVDPIESERQRVRAEAEALASMRNMSTQEIQLGFKAAELDRLATQQWGARIAQAGGLENLAKQDPQAARQVMEAKAAYDQLVAQSQNYAQMRQANEVLLQNTRAAELARVNRVEGEKAATEFTKYVESRDPQWKSDPDYRQSLQKMAADIVEEVAPGSAAAIQRGEMYVTTGQQKALYDVARARLSDERIRASMESGRQKAMNDLPKVMRPGNGETRAEAAAHDFGARLNALPSMSPTDAAKAGARLLAARRSAARNAR
jgi:hypothetical protein